METQKVKRRRLFLDEGVTADENRQTGERLERASTSKNDDALEGQNYVEQSKRAESADEVCPTECLEGEVGDVTPKRNLRTRTPMKNSVPEVEKGFVNWSNEEKEKLLFNLEIDGFDGDLKKLADKTLNRSAEALRYLITQCQQDREKRNWEVMLDSKIEDLRKMERSHMYENVPLCLQLYSLYGTLPESSQVGGVDYSAVYAYIASLMRGEIPKKLNSATMAKLSQVFHLLKQRILEEPEVPLPEFQRNEEFSIEKMTDLKERRSIGFSVEELRAKDALLSGDVASIEELYMSQASLNPF